jgi:phosphoribosylpyrophosphate synthetase
MADLISIIKAQAVFLILYKEIKRFEQSSVSTFYHISAYTKESLVSIIKIMIITYLYFRSAEKEAPLESISATHVQRLFRGARAREEITFKRFHLYFSCFVSFQFKLLNICW